MGEVSWWCGLGRSRRVWFPHGNAPQSRRFGCKGPLAMLFSRRSIIRCRAHVDCGSRKSAPLRLDFPKVSMLSHYEAFEPFRASGEPPLRSLGTVTQGQFRGISSPFSARAPNLRTASG